jgi:mannose/fructose/N-acetylgalactosamine-specific phosphotransferase system component IID
MQAGYLIGNWIMSKLRSWGANALTGHLANIVGGFIAGALVKAALTGGAAAVAAYIGTHSAVGASLGGPIAGIAFGLLGAA